MARSSETQRSPASQENLLLDYIHRLEKHKDDRKAVQSTSPGSGPTTGESTTCASPPTVSRT